MIHLLLAMALAAPTLNTGSIGENRMTLRDPQQGPMAVSGEFLIPGRVPECANAEEVQRAQEERIKGWEPECMLPRVDRRKLALPH